MLNSEGSERRREVERRGVEEEEDDDYHPPSPAPTPPSLPHSVSTSLACQLRFLNAYRLSVQPKSENTHPEDNHTNANHPNHHHNNDADNTDADNLDDEGGEYRVRWEGQTAQVAREMAKLEGDMATADVTLRAKSGPPVPGHRLVLAAASPFFRSVMQNVSPEQHPVIVVVAGSSPHHLLRQLVSFCYSGSITLPAIDIPPLLQLAEELEVTGLIQALRRAHTLTSSNPSHSPHPPSTSSLTPHPSISSSPHSLSPHHHQSSPLPLVSHLPLSLVHSPSALSLPPPRSHPHHPLRSYRPPSPTHFPFTPPLPHTTSPPDTPKRTSTPLDLKDEQAKKKVKVELTGRDEGGTSSPSSAFPAPPPPPGSAPPFLDPYTLLPSSSPRRSPSSFSPPHSAPPHQNIRGPSPLSLIHPQHHSSHGTSTEESSLRLIPAPRLLQPTSTSSTSTTTSNSSPSSSPRLAHPLPYHHPPPSPLLSADLPLTPSTPSTPGGKPEGGRGSTSSANNGSSSSTRVLLWRFLLDLLHDSRYTPYYIRWLDRSDGIFRIMESDMVAQLWGMARKNSNMNYEKMSRGMRTYYKRGILYHIDGTKLIYRFNIHEPEIQQRMKYYDLTRQQKGEEGDQQPTTSYMPPAGLPTPPVPIVTSVETSYSPLLTDAPHLSRSLLPYYPYLSLLGVGNRELY